MNNADRINRYEAQNGREFQLTPRQAKRVRKHLNRATGDSPRAERHRRAAMETRLQGAPLNIADIPGGHALVEEARLGVNLPDGWADEALKGGRPW